MQYPIAQQPIRLKYNRHTPQTMILDIILIYLGNTLYIYTVDLCLIYMLHCTMIQYIHRHRETQTTKNMLTKFQRVDRVQTTSRHNRESVKDKDVKTQVSEVQKLSKTETSKQFQKRCCQTNTNMHTIQNIGVWYCLSDGVKTKRLKSINSMPAYSACRPNAQTKRHGILSGLWRIVII